MKNLTRACLVFALTFVMLCASLPIIAQAQLTGATAVQTNLRAIPSRNGKILGSLPAHTDIWIEARNAAADWLLVYSRNAQRGWLQTRQVQFAAAPDLNALPISDATIGGPADSKHPLPAATTVSSPAATSTASLQTLLADPSRYAAQITPAIQSTIRTIYLRGLKLGNNPRVFTKVGDCWSAEYWAFPQFGDGQPYNLGAFGYLQSVISYYSVSPRAGVANSFVNPSQVARDGFSLTMLFDATWSDPKLCQSGESPLTCEFRASRPSVVIIMLGMGEVTFVTPAQFRVGMQRLVQESLQQGVIPILSTVPNPPIPMFWDIRDEFNKSIRSIAQAHNLPLVELASAAENLPDRGVDPDDVHPTPYFGFTRLSFSPDQFSRGAVLWDFLALQSLYNVWRVIGG